MGIITSDTFTVGADTNLTDHTPDTGSAWVQVAITGTRRLICSAATDVATATGNTNSAGEYDKSQPAPTSTDVDVQITLTTVDTGATNNRKCRLHARGSGTTDYYALTFRPTGAASNDTELVKVVSSTLTSLTSVDTGLVANDVFVLEIRDAAKRALKNGAQILTSSDNAITAAGDCGFSMGQVSATDVGNIASTWQWDDYSVTDVTSGTQYTQSADGTLTTAGLLVKQAQPLYAGTLTTAGSLTDQTQKVLAGTLTTAGSLVKQTGKVLAGALASSGALVATKVALLSLTATLTSAGGLVKQTGPHLTGGLASAANVAKRTATSLAASLTPSGTEAGAKVALVALVGTLTSAGALVTQYIAGTVQQVLTFILGSEVIYDQDGAAGTVTGGTVLTQSPLKGATGTITGGTVQQAATMLDADSATGTVTGGTTKPAETIEDMTTATGTITGGTVLPSETTL